MYDYEHEDRQTLLEMPASTVTKPCDVCGASLKMFDEHTERRQRCENCQRFCCYSCLPSFASSRLCLECPTQTNAGMMRAARRGIGDNPPNDSVDPYVRDRYPHTRRKWEHTKGVRLHKGNRKT